MRQPYSDSAEVTLCRNSCSMKCFYQQLNNNFMYNPVLILGQGYTFLRFNNK